MLRPSRARALAVLVATAAGCQDYNFNPVGRCLIQPGSEHFTLSSITTADILFVIDDSGSMGGEQAALARNFDAFIANLDRTNAARAGGGLPAIDFHIAVTTSSVFWNYETAQLCRSDCPGAEGQLVCCSGQTPARQPRRCGSSSECSAGTSCRLNCSGLLGERYCCADDGTFPPSAVSELVPCSREAVMCGSLETHYDFHGCTSPTSADRWPYPQGAFVSRTASGVGRFAGLPGPRVLHFDKELYGATGVNKQGFTRGELIDLFRENVQVGTCGSGEEQLLQAGRLAVQKALAGEQRDTYDASGARAWTPPTGTQPAGSVAARWPHAGAKLVVVFVGDEDDCSSPPDPSGGVVMLSEGPGSDACTRDAITPPPLGAKEFPVADLVGYLTNLGRPVAAAFILPAAEVSCTFGTCTDGGLCCPASGCNSVDGAQARGTRLLAAARALSAAGIEVVEGSICDPDFGKLLNDVAEIVKPPQTLSLPSEPAESRISLLRIADANGNTLKLCGTALQGAYASLAAAQATGADWWFTASADPGVPVPVSRFAYINPSGSCRANPGETYSVEYLGLVPASGCATDADCTRALGGKPGAFSCYMPTGLVRGTCTCTGAR
jgi:hypothetical protein